MSGRREKDYISPHGRDQGKKFKLKEMPAMQAEKWANRAFLALARSGIDIPADIASQGMAGVAIVGLKMFGGVEWSLAEPLMDEMFQCISIYLPNNDMMTRPPTGQDDIEEVRTIYDLRKEVLELHLGFSIAEWALSLTSTKASQDSSATSTSQAS